MRDDAASNQAPSEGAATIDADRDRKAEHIELALDPAVELLPSAFDGWRLEHQALPEIDMAAIDSSMSWLGRRLRAPLLVSCMTGGTAQAASINENLARAAETVGVALGVGSQRKAIEEPELAATYEVRRWAPSVPIVANLGAVQLNYGYGVDQCRAAVEMVDADALALHLNPLQEAIQPEGQTDFSGLAERIAEVVAALEVPVIVKEVGSGLSASTVRRLYRSGIRHFDTAGLGGTSWSRIEGARAGDRPLGELFADWGVPTVESLEALTRYDDVTVIASGGVRSGLDIAKALALGADLAGLARPYLGPATESASAVEEALRRTVRELRIAMFCSGALNLDALGRVAIEPLGG